MKLFSFCLAMMLSLAGFSQTQADIEKRMKEAQEVLDKLTPEQKKMMEQMGINPDPMKGLPSPNTPQAKQAMADHNNFVPKKDDAGIAAANKTILTNANTASFINSTQAFVAGQLKPELRKIAEKVTAELNAKKTSAKSMGSNAIALWIMGKTEIALYVMGKACQMDPADNDNLGNYAAMLTSCGAPQLAVPMLNKLNALYPKNSTILNNLGQAWFGLGELTRARKYLDSTMAMYANHPQAAMTAAAIEESKGNTAAAVDLVKKAIKNHYTNDKHNKLRKLGASLKASDLNSHPFKKDSDPLGLHQFQPPPFPKSVEELVGLSGQWKAYNDERMALSQKISEQMAPYINKPEPADYRADMPMSSLGTFMLQQMNKDGGARFRLKEAEKALRTYEAELKKLKAEYKAKEEQINKRDEAFSRDLKREGGDEREGFCPERRQLLTEYLAKVSPRYEELYKTYLKELSIYTNEEVYWEQFTMTGERFYVNMLGAKGQWIAQGKMEFLFDLAEPPISERCAQGVEKKPASSKLRNFNDINCNVKSEVDYTVGKISFNCSTLTATLNLKFIELGLNQDMDKAGFFDSFQSGTIKLKADASIGKAQLGPLEIEAGVEGSIELEITREGVKDIRLGAELGMVNSAVEGKVSLITGRANVEATKILGVSTK